MAAIELGSTSLFNDANLLSYWSFNASSSVDNKGSNNGTDTAITYSLGNGRFGVGAGFDGSTSKIVVKTSNIISAKTNASVSLWMNTTLGLTDFDRALYCERGSSGNDIWKLELISDDFSGYNIGEIDFVHRDDAGTLNNHVARTTVTVNDGAWHHVVLTKAGTAILIYIDAVQRGSTTLTGNDTMTNASLESWIGQDKGDSTAKFPGAIDDVALFDRALSLAEVAMLYNGGMATAYMTTNTGMWGI